MKKIFSMLMLGAMIAVTSCTKEVTESIANGDTLATVTISAPDAATRAAYALPTGDLRLFVIVSYNGTVVDSAVSDSWDGVSEMSYDFRLVSSQPYTISAWADYGSTYYDVTYDLGYAPKIAMTTTSKQGAYAKEDAYFAIASDVTFSSSSDNDVDLVLSRPFGLVIVNTTDLDTPALANADIDINVYSRGYMTMPTSLSLLDGSVGDEASVYTVGSCNGEELAYDYFLVDESATFDFTYNFKDGNTQIMAYDFTNIPVRRNYITNISGNILTTEGAINITLDQDWENNSLLYDADTNTTYDVIASASSSSAYKEDLTLTNIVVNGSTGTSAFSKCYNLESVILSGTGSSTMGSSAFLWCYSLTSIVIDGYASTGSNSFNSCTALKDVELCEGFQTLNTSTFAYCSSIETIVIPESLVELKGNVFSNCTSLKSVIFQTATPPIATFNTFSNLDFDNFTIYVPKGATDAYRNYTINPYGEEYLPYKTPISTSVVLNIVEME